MSLKVSVDFTGVKEASGINPKRMAAGDYAATISKVTKEQSKAGNDQLVFLFTLKDHRTAVYPYYVGLDASTLWKLRNILLAVGAKAPKGKANIDVERLVGRDVGITLEDDEYEGKDKSVIDAVFSVKELDDESAPMADEPDDDDEDEKPAKKSEAAEPADDDEDELDELDL